jgi:hypothetical protein
MFGLITGAGAETRNSVPAGNCSRPACKPFPTQRAMLECRPERVSSGGGSRRIDAAGTVPGRLPRHPAILTQGATMIRSMLVVLACLVVMPMSANAQAAPYREGSVWDLSFIRVHPGMGDEYLNNLRSNWRRGLEEMKAQGVVTSYKIISSEPATRDDWGLLLMVEYPNMAALDRTDALNRQIAAQMAGGEEAQRAGVTQRAQIREIIGGKIGRELILNP